MRFDVTFILFSENMAAAELLIQPKYRIVVMWETIDSP